MRKLLIWNRGGANYYQIVDQTKVDHYLSEVEQYGADSVFGGGDWADADTTRVDVYDTDTKKETILFDLM